MQIADVWAKPLDRTRAPTGHSAEIVSTSTILGKLALFGSPPAPRQTIFSRATLCRFPASSIENLENPARARPASGCNPFFVYANAHTELSCRTGHVWLRRRSAATEAASPVPDPTVFLIANSLNFAEVTVDSGFSGGTASPRICPAAGRASFLEMEATVPFPLRHQSTYRPCSP